MTLSWQAIGTLVMVSSILGAGAVSILRAVLGRDFAKRVDLGAVEKRMAEGEERMARMPTHGDLMMLSARVSAVESAVAASNAAIKGVGDGVSRVERMVEILVRDRLGARPDELR